MPIDLETPESVIRTYLKYIDAGRYEAAFSLHCTFDYYEQLPTKGKNVFSTEELPKGPAPIKKSKDSFVNNMAKVFDDLDIVELEVLRGIPITTNSTRRLYGIGTVAEEGFLVPTKLSYNRQAFLLNFGSNFYVVKYKDRYCIAR